MGRGNVTLRKRVALSVDAPAAPAPAPAPAEAWEGRQDDEQPVSPTGRLFREPHFNCYIVCVLGSGIPIDLAAVRPGLEATLVRHPRFCSIQVLDNSEVDAKPKWVRTTVNLDDHIVIPDLDPAATSAEPDKALEDYVSSLSTLPMDHSRPLWDFHVLNFPTSEAAAAVAVRMHHSLGDGVSLLSLLVACTRSAADPGALPALPQPGRAGPLYALPPRPPLLSAAGGAGAGAGLRALAAWVASFLVLAWHTVADAARMAATVLFARDPPTVFMGEEGAEFRPKRFVSGTLSLDDIKYIKNAMNCTVNDVLLGVTSAGLSRYHFRAADNLGKRSVRVRATLFVNIRPTPGLQALSKMMETAGKDDGLRWGNRLGFMMLPFDLATHEDPLEYVRRGAEVARRKKSSLECVLTYWTAIAVEKLLGIKAAAAICYKMFTHTTLLFSSTVGPIEPVVLCGQPLVYIAPAVYGLPKALSVHYQSYVNTMKLVIAVDEAQFPDPHKLLNDFAESLRLIREAAAASRDRIIG